MVLDVKRSVRNSRLLAKILFAGSVFLCSAGNVLADLVITKTIDGTTTIPAAENDVVRYNISVTNTGIGPGNLNNVIINDTPANLTALNFTQTSGSPSGNQIGNQFRLSNLANGATVTLNLDATVNSAGGCPVVQNSVSVSENSGTFSDNAVAPDIEYDFQFTYGAASNVISHVNTSFCELCATGVVRIAITNPTTAVMTNIVLEEDLQSLGLIYINNSTTLNGLPTGNPQPPSNGSILRWGQGEIGALANLAAGATIEIAFDVSTYTEASLQTNASRDIIATATFDMACLTANQSVNTGAFELPLQEPVPQITKLGRNVDGGQNSGNYTPIVFGQEFDDIIWRVDIQNSGLAGLQDLLIADTVGGNFVVNYICPTQAAAETTAIANNGVAPGSGCVVMTPSFAVDDPFGNPAGDEPTTFVDVPAGGNAFVYYVGRINASCTDGEFNTADIQWGCEATSPDGGIFATSTGLNPAQSSAELSTDNGAGLTIVRDIRGIDGGAEIGSNGVVTITVTNTTGGTIRDIVLDDLLPVEYVRDTSFTPLLAVNTLHSAYDGMIDTIVDTNEDTVTLLNNIQPVFTLTSSTARSEGASTDNDNMLRAGDVATI
ncbi:MAG: hypothetical protein COB77_03880, partial [Gammaproteobacteria bacterium]